MATAQFKPPQQWEDWCSWGLGIWLLISPWALRFDLDSGATRVAVITGILIILTEMLTLSFFQSWEEWVNVVLGLWLLVASWVVGIATSAAVRNFVIVGLLVLILAAYEIWQGRSGAESQT